jgi:hypothetical protein
MPLFYCASKGISIVTKRENKLKESSYKSSIVKCSQTKKAQSLTITLYKDSVFFNNPSNLLLMFIAKTI